MNYFEKVMIKIIRGEENLRSFVRLNIWAFMVVLRSTNYCFPHSLAHFSLRLISLQSHPLLLFCFILTYWTFFLQDLGCNSLFRLTLSALFYWVIQFIIKGILIYFNLYLYWLTLNWESRHASSNIETATDSIK